MSGAIPDALRIGGETQQPSNVHSRYLEQEFTPLGNIADCGMYDLIKMQFVLPDFFDPASARFEIEVEVKEEDIVKSGLVLDGQSTSLIQDLTIYSNGKQLEQILHYDRIGQFLQDHYMDMGHRRRRYYEGTDFTYTSDYQLLNNQFIHNRSSKDDFPGFHVGSYTCYPQAQFVGWKPQSNQFPTLWRQSQLQPYQNALSFGFSVDPLATSYYKFDIANDGGIQYDANAFLKMMHNYPFDYNYDVWGTRALPLNGGTYHVDQCNARFDHTLGITSGRYGCQTSLSSNYGLISFPADSEPIWNAENWKSNSVLDNKLYPLTEIEGFINTHNPLWTHMTQYETRYSGYQVPYSGYLQSNGIAEILSPHIPQVWLARGQGLRHARALTCRNFVVPLLSSTMGALRTDDQWSLLPGWAYGQLNFELRLNPYAFFASGLANDSYNYTNQTFGDQEVLKWRVKCIKFIVDTYQFNSTITNSVIQQLSSGVAIKTVGFSWGPYYTLADTRQVENTWQLNMGIPELIAFYFFIASNDYLTHSFCRKHFNLSANVTSIQYKLGSMRYPDQPITGHAGSIAKTDISDKTNREFFEWYQKCMGLFYQMKKKTAINPLNFALNDRLYDPDKRLDCISGITLFQEMRAIGKAIYPISFNLTPALSSDQQIIDTRQFRPFEVNIKVDKDYYNNRPCTLYFFAQHIVRMQFKNDGVFAEGWG